MYYFTRFMRAVAVIALAVGILTWLAFSSVFGAEIVGSDTITTGELATFTADIEGDCLVYPSEGIGLAKDTNKKTFYIVGKNEGVYTLIFFGVENGNPALKQFEFVIVPDVEPEPEPKPEPKPIYNLTETEKETAIYALESVLNHIDRGTIRTPQGARATFKNAVKSRVSDVSEGFGKVLDQWTNETDFTNVQTIKTSFERIRSSIQ